MVKERISAYIDVRLFVFVVLCLAISMRMSQVS